MNKICTSIEQSQELIELGIDVSTADMYWANDALPLISFPLGDIDADWDYAMENGMVPAWSLAALLKLMPKSIISTPNPFSDNYCCRNVEFDMEFYADNPVDAAFETLSWLLENKNYNMGR